MRSDQREKASRHPWRIGVPYRLQIHREIQEALERKAVSRNREPMAFDWISSTPIYPISLRFF